MKRFTRIFLLLLIFAICIFNIYKFARERIEEKRHIELRKRQIEEERRREIEEERRLRDANRREKEESRKRREKLHREYLEEKTAAASPPKKRSTVIHRHDVEKVCRKHNCRLLQYHEEGHAIYILVSSSDHSSISDILDPLVAMGVVNFTEHKDKFGARMIQGKRIYTAAYTLRW